MVPGAGGGPPGQLLMAETGVWAPCESPAHAASTAPSNYRGTWYFLEHTSLRCRVFCNCMHPAPLPMNLKTSAHTKESVTVGRVEGVRATSHEWRRNEETRELTRVPVCNPVSVRCQRAGRGDRSL